MEITLLDPFDVYWDPRATGFDDAEHITFSTSKPLSVIRSNPIYENTDEVRADNRISYSSYNNNSLEWNYCTYFSLVTILGIYSWEWISINIYYYRDDSAKDIW